MPNIRSNPKAGQACMVPTSLSFGMDKQVVRDADCEDIQRAPQLAALNDSTTPAATMSTPSFEHRGVSIEVLRELLRKGQQWHSGRRVLLVRHGFFSGAYWFVEGCELLSCHAQL